MNVPDTIKNMSLQGLLRIDVALEGNWSQTVKTVWTVSEGFAGFAEVFQSHPDFVPSLEIYFDGYWLGIHCYNNTKGQNVFDKKLAKTIIDYIERMIKI